MIRDLAVVKISLAFNEETVRDLKELSARSGFEVKYLCHDVIPSSFTSDDIVISSHLRMSASRSRNLLYRHVNATRVLFLDEDAILSEAATQFLIDFLPRNERCHIIFSGKKSISVEKKLRLNDWNFYKINHFFCEWNTIYDKNLVLTDKLFPGIGVGSRHEFWSGEGTCSLLNMKPNSTVYLRPESILHPPLSNIKDFNTARMYLKGYGFAMSYIFRKGSLLLKLITLVRFVVSVVRDVFFPKRISPSVNSHNSHVYGIYSMIWKLQGFYGQKK